MKLKPGLFQLIVVIMTLSLVTSCGGNPNNQADCNNQPEAGKVANKQPNDCQPNSSSGGARTGNRFRGSGSNSSSSYGDSNSSSTKSRGGFGSFGRGGFGGG
jgi:hypothetical protein